MDALYFGCWNQTGHYFFTPNGYKVWNENLPTDFPGDFHFPDAVLAPYTPNGYQLQGPAALIHAGDWTALAFWDRTIDRRTNSNSNFFFQANLNFEQACARAEAIFPSIWARFDFPLQFAAERNYSPGKE